jgi:hypothetical protein
MLLLLKLIYILDCLLIMNLSGYLWIGHDIYVFS